MGTHYDNNVVYEVDDSNLILTPRVAVNILISDGAQDPGEMRRGGWGVGGNNCSNTSRCRVIEMRTGRFAVFSLSGVSELWEFYRAKTTLFQL